MKFPHSAKDQIVKGNGKKLTIKGADGTLKERKCYVPIGQVYLRYGVSGSGKSTDKRNAIPVLARNL